MSYMDINLTGEIFTDYQLSDVGSSAFQLEHDWFTKQDLVIRTASGGGGTLLVEGTDYTLSVESEDLSDRVTAAVGAGRNVYHNIAIINAPYQSGDLYFSGKYIADSNSAEDMNWLRRRFESVAVSEDDYTIDDEDPDTVLVTAGASARTITLPTAADNADRQITVVKVDSGAGVVTVDGEGAETINGDASVALVSQYDRVRILCDGTGWHILSIRATYDTGWINRSDWTNVHLGSTSDPKNTDSLVAHKLGVPLSELLVQLLISTDGSDANSFEPRDADSNAGGRGFVIYAHDDDNVKVQTADTGIGYQNDNGTFTTLGSDNWYYKVRVSRVA